MREQFLEEQECASVFVNMDSKEAIVNRVLMFVIICNIV
jgi:hypothetical protein